MAVSRTLLCIAVAVGLAGPAQSLMATHSLHQAVWSAALDGQMLSFWQLLGLAFGLMGVAVISTIDTVIDKIKQNKSK